MLAPVTAEDVLEFERQVKQLVDPEIAIGKYTKNDMKKVDGYHHFMAAHCVEGTYSLQIRKCGNANCCRPVRSPDGVIPPVFPNPMMKPDDRAHYQTFESLLGQQTDESHMPSSTNTPTAKVAEEQQVHFNTLIS
ncbi:PREDICTED: uncharacterized protein LOC106805000 [Priapulus caudatus]|uniref:Uncharacterized protein LOC106805000 n=1 Tax=Priapulus caudatus TaxID=37621 RepID=A0ABM1DPR6_PRICU|nr:PREDICTED: uncharacterized protein LOC106805000 [Priapulus caudatus]